MARSRANNRAAAASSAQAGGLKLLDLPCALLESILLLLSLKLRLRFSTTCRAARQLVRSSPCLCREVSATCRSRTQTLALMRWLASGFYNPQALWLYFFVQRVPIDRQLVRSISMQAPSLEAMLLRSHDGPLALAGSWLSSLSRLLVLSVQATAVELGNSCGQLTALRDLHVQNGWEMPSQQPYVWPYDTLHPGTLVVQPDAIPSGLTRITIRCVAMAELPSALCAATGLRELRLDHCPTSLDPSGWSGAAVLEHSISCFTALQLLQLRRLHLEDQPSLPTLLAGLTSLQHLDLTDSPLCPGGEQALCSALSQLSSLTTFCLGSHGSSGSVRAAPAALPNLLELRRVLAADCADQSLQLVEAAPQLKSLMVAASSLLSEHNLQLLRELPQLQNLAIMLPNCDTIWQQIDESGAARLVDAIASLPALKYVLLLYGHEEMEKDPYFSSIKPALEELEERDLFVYCNVPTKQLELPLQL